MNSYRQRFFALLLPISIVTTIISLFYLQDTYGHSITQTLPLASIFGFLSGTVLSFISAFIFLIPPKIQNTKADLSHRKKASKETTVKKEEKTKIPEVFKKEEIQEEKKAKILTKIISPTSFDFIMLMDRELTFQVAVHAINEENIGTLKEYKVEKESIDIQMESNIIALNISKLTRHTSKVVLSTTHHAENVRKIISYMKEKEYSFLNYESSSKLKFAR